jgi:hypothetical protein
MRDDERIGKYTVNKENFWEELIAYFPFAAILVCMRNEVSKTTQFGRLNCYYCTVHTASDGMIHMPSFMKISSVNMAARLGLLS